MTSARVLATQHAKDSAQQLMSTAGQLREQIQRIVQQGKVLTNPNEWDGTKAQQWRQEWEADEKQLQQAAQKMDELEKKAQQVVQAIMQAG
jgi:guanyl-specific ribonuclease Sa